MSTYDWAEPGDPPNADYKSVKAKPPGKPVKYASLTQEREIDLVRRYREDGDLDALEELAGAHRPMVVSMAKGRWRGNGTSLAALVEYGMFGVRLAAEPPRPSETKKGKLVGFDPESCNRFGTYARHRADKEMRAALEFDPRPERSAELEAKADIAKASWWDRDELEENDDPLLSAGGHKVLFRDLQHRRPYDKPYRPWTLWTTPDWAKDQYKRKVRPRNFPKHPRSKKELANLDASHYWAILKTWVEIIKEDEDDEDPWPYFVAQENYGKVIIKRKRQPTPFLCLRPIASIYLLRGEDALEVISRRRYRPNWNYNCLEEQTMKRPTLHTEKMILNLPHELAEAIKTIARRQFTSKAEYMRRAVLIQLERDGICLANLEAA